MNRRVPAAITLIAVLLSLIGTVVPAAAATGDPVLINEVLASHTGTDDTEYIELYGTPGTSLDGLSIIVVEGDEGSGQGGIDRRFDFKPFHTIGANGFFLIGNCAGVPANYGQTPDARIGDAYLENSSLTVALVETESIADGAVDGTEVVLDAVALADNGAADAFYFSAPVIGPDGTYFPAGARRVADGVDTDTALDWLMSDFNLGPDNTPTGGGIDGCKPLAATIPEIQGYGHWSPYQDEVVVTTGIVTLFNASESSFWMQDALGDGDPATSDGIFVNGGGYPDEGPRPTVGDLIEITASVGESQYGTELPLTRLTGYLKIEVLSSGNPLPAPIELIDLPNVSMPEGIAFWEPLEGMLVSVRNAIVIAPTSAYGEFGMLTERDAASISGYKRRTSQLLIRSLGGENVDYNPERIMVDDYTLADPIVVQPGDEVHSLVGALDYNFGVYKIQPANWDITTQPIPEAPVSKRLSAMGDTVITTFNVENLFDLEVGVTVDAIGKVGHDPGSEWGSGITSTQDNTIRRVNSVCQGDADSGDDFDPSVEWVGFPKDTLDGLGAHATACGPATGLFFSEYVEGGSYNKALEIYNGTGGPVDLAAGNYVVEIYFNGGTDVGRTIDLTGEIVDGDTYVIAHTSAHTDVLAVADLVSGAVLFNGDDAVVLRQAPKDDASSTPSPEELETQLSKLALAVEVEMELPDILVVQEVENTAILQELGDRVNASAGTAYTAVSYETSDARGIEVGFLWDASRVALVDSYQMTGTDVEAAFGPSSPSPGREPLVGVFNIGGKEVTIVGNHFKSKSGDDALFGLNWPPIRITEVQRKAQARVVRDFVNSILATNPRALVMVAGDLNDFQFSEPGEGPDHPVAILGGEYGEVPLIDLIKLELPAERFTYVYDGNSQVLDHMLVSPALFLHFRGVDILHFNTSLPATLSDDPTTPLYCSDHDPIEGRFQFTWKMTPWKGTWNQW